jgi:hypothetical protein
MTFLLQIVKLPAHSAELPGNDLLFNTVPLDPAHRAGLAGHAPVKMFVSDCLILQCLSLSISKTFVPEEQAKH